MGTPGKVVTAVFLAIAGIVVILEIVDTLDCLAFLVSQE